MSKNKHAAALGKRGGRARAKSLNPERLIEIARLGGLQAQANRRQLSVKHESGQSDGERKNK